MARIQHGEAGAARSGCAGPRGAPQL
jgi:hypothetical protein